MPSNEYIFMILNKNETERLSLSEEFLNKCNSLLHSYTKLTQKRNHLKKLKERKSCSKENRVRVCALERDIQVLSGEIKKMKRKNNQDHKEWKDHHESVTKIIKNYFKKRSKKATKAVNSEDLSAGSTRKRPRLGLFEHDYKSEKSGDAGNKDSKYLMEGIEKISFNESYF